MKEHDAFLPGGAADIFRRFSTSSLIINFVSFKGCRISSQTNGSGAETALMSILFFKRLEKRSLCWAWSEDRSEKWWTASTYILELEDSSNWAPLEAFSSWGL